MRFTPAGLDGAFVIDIEAHRDSRGFFARGWCQREFEERGLVGRVVQSNISYNGSAGTLRGMHHQLAPHEEIKVVRCTAGAIHDVIVDLRPESRTFREWVGVELTSENRRMLYVPGGFAHGFVTLIDNSEVAYHVSEFYHPESEAGLRYDDPAIGIRWPVDVRVISDKDRSWPDLET